MTSIHRVALMLFSALVPLACSIERSDAVQRANQPAIVDALHGDASERVAGFYFLPPIVPRPAMHGDFVPTANPTVQIDEVDPSHKSVVRTVATFTATSGPAGERVRVHYQDRPCDPDDDDGDTDPEGYFVARWRTDDVGLSPAATYRVRVLVAARGGGTREVGHADVDVVRNQREFRAVNTAEFVPLVNGRTLRIKFRLDRPAVDRDGDGVLDWSDNCPATPNVDQRDSVGDRVGDACRCATVTCRAPDTCHTVGACDPTTGACSSAPIAGCVPPGFDAGAADASTADAASDARATDAWIDVGALPDAGGLRCEYAGPADEASISAGVEPCLQALTDAPTSGPGSGEEALRAFQTCLYSFFRCGVPTDGGVASLRKGDRLPGGPSRQARQVFAKTSDRVTCAMPHRHETGRDRAVPPPRSSAPRRERDNRGSRPDTSPASYGANPGDPCVNPDTGCQEAARTRFIRAYRNCLPALVTGALTSQLPLPPPLLASAVVGGAVVAYMACLQTAYWTYQDELHDCEDQCALSGLQCVDRICCLRGQVTCGGRCLDATARSCTGGMVFDEVACECRCPGGTVNTGGICCNPGEANCDGRCRRTWDDENNCGACNNVCTAGSVCTLGTCECPPATALCGGVCLPATGIAYRLDPAGTHCWCDGCSECNSPSNTDRCFRGQSRDCSDSTGAWVPAGCYSDLPGRQLPTSTCRCR